MESQPPAGPPAADGPERRRADVMLSYFIRRVLVMIPTLLVISLMVFVIIQLPPGDYLETLISELRAQGENVDPARIEWLRQQYGLGKPMIQQSWRWLFGPRQGEPTTG